MGRSIVVSRHRPRTPLDTIEVVSLDREWVYVPKGELRLESWSDLGVSGERMSGVMFSREDFETEEEWVSRGGNPELAGEECLYGP
jgi:hypothetical protein